MFIYLYIEREKSLNGLVLFGFIGIITFLSEFSEFFLLNITISVMFPCLTSCSDRGLRMPHALHILYSTIECTSLLLKYMRTSNFYGS